MDKKTIDIVMERSGGLCESCGAMGANIHHVVFKGLGGRKGRMKKELDQPDNLKVLCLVCHGAAHGLRIIT